MKAELSLMRRFDVPENLIGDLVEQQRGRSLVWFWRQVIDAIAKTVGTTVKQDKRANLAVAVVSFMALLVWVESTWVLHAWVMNAKLAPVIVTISASGHLEPWQRWVMEWWGPLYTLPLGLVWCLGSALIGRAAGHHRAAAAVVVSLFAQLPLICWWGIPLWRQAIGYIGREAAHPMDVPLVTLTALVWFGIPLATVLAGLAAPRRRDAIA